MIDRRVAELELLKSNEDERVASHIAEAESKAEERLRDEREQQVRLHPHHQPSAAEFVGPGP